MNDQMEYDVLFRLTCKTDAELCTSVELVASESELWLSLVRAIAAEAKLKDEKFPDCLELEGRAVGGANVKGDGRYLDESFEPHFSRDQSVLRVSDRTLPRY